MFFSRPSNHIAGDTFSEVRGAERERLLLAIAVSTLASTGFLISAVLVALGAIA